MEDVWSIATYFWQVLISIKRKYISYPKTNAEMRFKLTITLFNDSAIYVKRFGLAFSKLDLEFLQLSRSPEKLLKPLNPQGRNSKPSQDIQAPLHTNDIIRATRSNGSKRYCCNKKQMVQKNK